MCSIGKCAVIAIIAIGLARMSVAAQDDSKSSDGGINCSCEIRNVDFAEPGEHQAEMMKKFDKDGDGKLSEAERDEAQTAALLSMVEKCQAMRDSFDKNKDGKLDAAEQAEFDKAIAEKREDVSDFIKTFDTDKDGKLSADERKHALENRMAQRLENWLEKFDKDNNGKLDAEESQALFADIRGSLEQRRESLWKQFDADNDGKLNDVERGTALKALGDAFQKRHTEMLAKYDTDKDGKLSADERKKIETAAIFCSCDAGEDTSKSALKSDETKPGAVINTSAKEDKSLDASDDDAR